MVELVGEIWGRSALAGVLLVLALAVYVAATAALTVIDFRERRLPNRIIFPGLAVALPLLCLSGMLAGEPMRALGAVGGAAAAFAVFFLIRFIHPPAMGFGDVKLVALLGAYLGFVSVEAILWALLLAFLAAGLVSLALIAARRATGKTAIAFGPYLILGSTLALIFA